MSSNKQLINTFYQSFQNKNYKAMQDCYADKAVFNDEVFVNLNAAEVKSMWEMLCKKGKNFDINFFNVQANEETGSAQWIADYTFSKTGRKVTNKIQANFIFENGKILKHTDSFNFYKWASQALAIVGILLGWTSFLKNKVRKDAKKSLEKFMSNKSL